MPRLRTLALTAAVAAMAALPATSLARQGADDGPNHDSTHTTRVDDSGHHNGGQNGKNGKKAKKNRVRVAGTCSPGVKSKLDLRLKKGQIKAKFEVDETKAGDVWQVVLSANGTTVKSVSATTTAPSDDFEVKVRVPKSATGTDTISATATGPAGQTCTASASL